jgi:hypothetical protein
MTLYLARQALGDYMLTALPPQWRLVQGTEHSDWYLQPGEPVGVRHLCARGVQLLFGLQLRRGEQCRVELTGQALAGTLVATGGLRR